MNFCGGGFEQQVSEPPIVTMRMHPLTEDYGGENSQPSSSKLAHIDLSVHPTCVVKNTAPQNDNSKASSTCTASSNNKNATTSAATGEGVLLANSKSNRKKLKQDSTNSNDNSNSRGVRRSSSSRSMSRSRSRSKQRSSSRPRTRRAKSKQSTSSRHRSRGESNSNNTTTTTTTTDEAPSSPEQPRRRTKSDSLSEQPLLTPNRPRSNSNSSSVSPNVLLNSPSPQRPNTMASAVIGKNTSSIRLPLLDSTSKTMESLLQKLEHGFRVTVHNGSDPRGKRVVLKLVQGRTCLMIRPVHGQDNDDSSIKFPVRTILRLEIGKTTSSVLNQTMYDRVHPLACFSIVVQLWTQAETYFDFEASTVLEREALIATLMVVLDQMHCHTNDSHTSSSNDEEEEDAQLRMHPEDAACLSPGKRTRIYNTPFFQEDPTLEEQLGTEMTLASPGYYDRHDDDDDDDDDSDDHRSNSGSSEEDPALPKKPLRQRHIENEKDDNDEHVRSPPRTHRIRSSSHRQHSLKKPLMMMPRTQSLKAKFRRSPQTKRTTLSNENAQHDADIHKEQPLEHRDVSPNVHSTTNATEVIAMKASHCGDEDNPRDVSYEVIPQGLPMMDKLTLTPPREFKDRAASVGATPRSMTADDATVREVMANQQAGGAWCTDDICTLALKDIAQSCTGIWDQSNCGGNAKGCASTADDERAHVEEYIADALGGQQLCTLNIYGGDVWNAGKSQQAKNNQDSELHKSRIKNRATLLNAQAVRLRALRNEMTFAAAVKRSQEKLHFVQTTKSFDDVDSQRLRHAQERSVNQLHSSALMEHVMGTMVFQQKNTHGLLNNNGDEDAVYYDSDPEDVRVRTKGVRRASANRRNLVATEEEGIYSKNRQPVLSGAGFERIEFGKKLRKLDEGLIIEIVQAMRNETLTLMWHPTQSKKNPNRQPVCVNVWIESGVYLVDGSFVLPRLSWNTAYENSLDNKKLNVSKADPEQIDLLDVCRVHATEKIDRTQHPFADARKSFVVETQDEVCLFEAQSAEERDRIVYGYKLVIARLASLLMLRDSRAVEEFFGSVNAMVPGVEPNWARK